MKVIENALIDALGRRKDNFDWRGRQPSLDLQSVESVCVLHHNEKLGDAILISLLVDALAKARPGLPLRVAAPASFAAYWSAHPAVTEVIVYDLRRSRPFPLRAVHGLRTALAWRGRLDVMVSFQPFVRLEQLAFLRCVGPRVLIGFNKDAYRLFDYSLEEHRQGVDLAPIASRTRSVMRVFRTEVDLLDLRPHLPFDGSDVARALASLPELSAKGPRLLVHTYGATRVKRLSTVSVRLIVEAVRRAGHLGPILVGVPEAERGAYEAILTDRATAVVGPQKDFPALFALVSVVDAVVSTDTSVGHVAAALGKPQICLFGRRDDASQIWRPLNPRCQVMAPERGEGVNAQDWAELEKAVERMLESLAPVRGLSLTTSSQTSV